MFRALGGDGGLQVEAANATQHGARRGLLDRIARSNKQVELAWRDDQALHLPAIIDYFPERKLNKDLYTWLAAMAGGKHHSEKAWFQKSQRLTEKTQKTTRKSILDTIDRLAEAHIALRIPPEKLPEAEATQESAIRQALLEPGNCQRPDARPCLPFSTYTSSTASQGRWR